MDWTLRKNISLPGQKYSSHLLHFIARSSPEGCHVAAESQQQAPLLATRRVLCIEDDDDDDVPMTLLVAIGRR
ncbi:hypothetical protein ACA910_014392 [Epithemia clementina (nom. ined.)]